VEFGGWKRPRTREWGSGALTAQVNHRIAGRSRSMLVDVVSLNSHLCKSLHSADDSIGFRVLVLVAISADFYVVESRPCRPPRPGCLVDPGASCKCKRVYSHGYQALTLARINTILGARRQRQDCPPVLSEGCRTGCPSAHFARPSISILRGPAPTRSIRILAVSTSSRRMPARDDPLPPTARVGAAGVG
jgi:hypothetical protein